MEEPLLSNSCCTCAYMESQCCYSHEYIITSEPVFLIEYLYFFYKKQTTTATKKNKQNKRGVSFFAKIRKVAFLSLFVGLIVEFL